MSAPSLDPHGEYGAWEAAQYDDDRECTHCAGEGLCWDGADPLGNCPDKAHRCHACNGSGDRCDQTIF